mgnify:CR=1 FL=1
MGETPCARAFQSAVACVNADRGTQIWSRNVGGVQPIGADADLVVAGDASDRLNAWRASNGAPKAWVWVWPWYSIVTWSCSPT